MSNRGAPEWLTRSSLFTEDSSLTYVLIAGLGVMNGLLAGVIGYALDQTVLNLHTTVWSFLIAWAATTAYLSYKRVASGVLATGLYFLLVFVLLQPVAVFGPILAAGSGPSDYERTRALIEGWNGILVWGVVAGVVALCTTFVRRLLLRRARRVRGRRRRDVTFDD